MDGQFFVITTIICLFIRRKKKTKQFPHVTPQISSQGNRLPSHAPLCGHATEEEARRHVLQTECSPFSSNLAGMWGFRLYASVREAMAAREAASSSSYAISSKDQIWVPSNWQLSSDSQSTTDLPLYTNVKYITKVDSGPLQLPDHNPTGYYWRQLSIPKWWRGRRLIIRFGGVDSCFYLYINGSYVGYSSDSRLDAEFDVTDILGNSIDSGEKAHLEVIVPRFSTGSYLEDQDMWNLSGIYRDVIIYSLPSTINISDFSCSCAPLGYSPADRTFASATISVDVQLAWSTEYLQRMMSGPTGTPDDCPYLSQMLSDWGLDVSLYHEGVLLSSRRTSTSQEFVFDRPDIEPIATNGVGVPVPERILYDNRYTTVHVKTSIDLAKPRAWSPECPELYTLVMTLRNLRSGEAVQVESCRVGLRTVDVTNGCLAVNGADVLIRGVNLHEHDPATGHTVAVDLIEADLKLMKRNNFNAVRCSHYPHTPWTYELCSLYGLFCVDEANIETHGMKPDAGRLARDPAWRTAFIERATRMYERDKTHPSIIMWSLGNEAGYGPVHDEMYTWLKERGDGRLVMYEPASYGHRAGEDMGAIVGDAHEASATDVISPMYARIEQCLHLAQCCPTKPVILCEYAHMMGNSGGNLDKYWQAFRSERRLQGGFIWDWVDQGLSVSVGSRPAFWIYGGDRGESSAVHDAQFCVNGLTWPNRGLGSSLSETRIIHNGYNGRREMVLPAHVYGLCPREFKGEGLMGMATELTVRVEEIEDVPIRSNAMRRVKSRGETEPEQQSSFHEGIELDGAVSKPTLLEAKVCMQPFTAVTTKMDCWPAKKAAAHITFDHSEKSKVVTRTSYSHETDEWEILVRSEFDVSFDNADNPFDLNCFLLFDGLVVAQEMLVAVNHVKDGHYYTTFSIHLHDMSSADASLIPSLHKETCTEPHLLLLGYRWPESALLSPQNQAFFPATLRELTPTKVAMNSAFTVRLDDHSDRWSTVVVAVTSAHSAWAPKGYPIGLVQSSCAASSTHFDQGLLDCIAAALPKKSKAPEKALPCRHVQLSKTISPETGSVTLSAVDGLESLLEVTVSSSTGTLQSLKVHGAEILHTRDNASMRIHLHRALTDNDLGYAARWKASGMDRGLVYMKNPAYSALSTQPATATDLTHFECTCLRTFDMTEGVGASFGFPSDVSGKCVEATWSMKPSFYDAMRVDIVRKLQDFAQDQSSEELILRDLDGCTEAFAYEVSNMLTLKRSSSRMSDDKTRVNIHITKPKPFFVNSTTRAALDLVNGPILDRVSGDATMRAGAEVAFPQIHIKMFYLLTTDAKLMCRGSIDTSALCVPIPRIGIQLSLLETMNHVAWCGAGPHECYPDRKASAVEAVHVAHAEHMTTPYLVPTENACRTSTRWVSISSSIDFVSGTRVMVDSGLGSFSFSTQKHSTEELSLMTHNAYLFESGVKAAVRRPVILNLDTHIMGVGGDDSWSSCVHEEFMIKPGVHDISFNFS